MIKALVLSSLFLASMLGAVVGCSSHVEGDSDGRRIVAAPTPPPEEPLTASFASIRKKIFVPLCQTCHSKSGAAFTVPLDTVSDLLDSPRELVVPGKPEESFLLRALTRQDKKRMPPPKSGIRPLTSDEIAIIEQWISDGAKP